MLSLRLAVELQFSLSVFILFQRGLNENSSLSKLERNDRNRDRACFDIGLPQNLISFNES